MLPQAGEQPSGVDKFALALNFFLFGASADVDIELVEEILKLLERNGCMAKLSFPNFEVFQCSST
jgi:hypothetical protein